MSNRGERAPPLAAWIGRQPEEQREALTTALARRRALAVEPCRLPNFPIDVEAEALRVAYLKGAPKRPS